MAFEINGVNLHYETLGDGEPLLWLHGFMGAGSDWRYVFNEPPAGYRLIAPDLRGHGASTNPSGSFSFREAANDVLGLLQHLQIETVKAIGVSGGGIVLLHMATLKPASIDAMVLVSAPPYFPPQALAIQRSASAAMFSEMEMQMMRQRHRYGQSQIDQLLANIRAFADARDDVHFTSQVLSTITAETLIVFGDRDPFYPVSIALELYEAIPRSFLWVVPNAGHGPVFGEDAPRFLHAAMSLFRGPTAA